MFGLKLVKWVVMDLVEWVKQVAFGSKQVKRVMSGLQGFTRLAKQVKFGLTLNKLAGQLKLYTLTRITSLTKQKVKKEAYGFNAMLVVRLQMDDS